MVNYKDMVYGTEKHRAARKQQSERHSDMGDDVMELGKMAVGGMVTVGVIGALGNAFHKD
jgi:hypothetical protein